MLIKKCDFKRRSNPKGAAGKEYSETPTYHGLCGFIRHSSVLVASQKKTHQAVWVHSCFLFCQYTPFPDIYNPQTLAPHVAIVHTDWTDATTVRSNTSTDVLLIKLLLVTDTSSQAMLVYLWQIESSNAPQWRKESRCASNVNELNWEGFRDSLQCQFYIWLRTTGPK